MLNIRNPSNVSCQPWLLPWTLDPAPLEALPLMWWPWGPAFLFSSLERSCWVVGAASSRGPDLPLQLVASVGRHLLEGISPGHPPPWLPLFGDTHDRVQKAGGKLES